MIDTACVVGAGRLGNAVAARLRERGVNVTTTGRQLEVGDPDLVLLCVPDRSIAEVAARVAPGPWVAHASGATGLEALAPHARRFSLHPLQTFSRSRGAEQLDGAYGALTAETPEALSAARELAGLLGLVPFELADGDRALYHAAGAIAANFLVTLQRAAGRLYAEVGAPPEGLAPLLHRVIDNGFELTGPVARGDWETVSRHVAALEERAPDLLPLYRAMTAATVELAVER